MFQTYFNCEELSQVSCWQVTGMPVTFLDSLHKCHWLCLSSQQKVLLRRLAEVMLNSGWHKNGKKLYLIKSFSWLTTITCRTCRCKKGPAWTNSWSMEDRHRQEILMCIGTFLEDLKFSYALHPWPCACCAKPMLLILLGMLSTKDYTT